jgi:hypothetical protein
MNSDELARYIEQTDGLAKPWLLVQLRMQKLREMKADLTPGEYETRLADLHQDLMQMGAWWKGREAEVFDAAPPQEDGHDR